MNEQKQYVVIGTYANQHKKVFVVMAENHNKAAQELLMQTNDIFIKIEILDTYGNIPTIEGEEREYEENA